MRAPKHFPIWLVAPALLLVGCGGNSNSLASSSHPASSSEEASSSLPAMTTSAEISPKLEETASIEVSSETHQSSPEASAEQTVVDTDDESLPEESGEDSKGSKADISFEPPLETTEEALSTEAEATEETTSIEELDTEESGEDSKGSKADISFEPPIQSNEEEFSSDGNELTEEGSLADAGSSEESLEADSSEPEERVVCTINETQVEELVNIHPEWDDIGVYSITLQKGDSVSFALDGESVHFYTWPDGFEVDLGTVYVATASGEHIFGINQDEKIWFEAPASEQRDIVTAALNGVEISLRNIHPDWPDYGVFFVTMAKGDTIRFFLDWETLHFYRDDNDIGVEYTAPRDGEYTFGVNPSEQVWFREANPIVSGTLNGEPLSLVDVKSSSSEDKAQYRLDLQVGDKVRFYLDEEPLHFYSWPGGVETDLGEEFVAAKAGEHNFGLKQDNRIWFAEPSE